MDDLMPCIDKLPDDKATLQRMVSTLEQIVLQQQKTINQQAEQIKYLQHRPKPVPINPNQPTLFDDEPLPEPPPPEAPQPEPPVKKKAKKKGHGRQRLSEHLPREIVTHTLSDAERACPCCGDLRNEIGEEISEKVDFQPAKAIVIQHVRKKYGCSKCLQTKAEQVNQVDETPSVIDIAPPPPSVIPKSLAEPGMLAQTIVSKFADHLPVYRQVSMLGQKSGQKSC